MDNQRKSSGSLADTSLRMLEEELLCDVTFLAGNSKQAVRAHRNMLASRSSVFYAMFCGPMAERTGEITVPDIEANSLKDLFKYMYSGIPQINADTVMSLWYAANKYDVPGMMKECGKYLKSRLTYQNVSVVLQKAVLFNDKDVIEDCHNLLTMNNGETAFTSKDFFSLTKESLQVVLQLEKLNVCEEAVYAYCANWAIEQCKRKGQTGTLTHCREALGHLLYLIRFPCMSQEFFTLKVANTNILSQEEKLDVFKQLCSSRAVGTFFSKTPRSTLIVIERFDRVNDRNWGSIGACDAISFRCSKNVYILGLGYYVPRQKVSENVGTVELFQGNTKLFTVKPNVLFKKDASCMDRTFTPQRLTKGVVYTVVQTFPNQIQRYGTDGRESVKHHVSGLKVTFLKSDKTISNTSLNRGQIPRLLLRL